jgi:DeoR/GlpR family transcriptional regulator of sugar metabolism
MVHERHDRIIKLLNTNRMVKVSELMKEFNVSIETVRRDLEFLEGKGYLKRVYGGAIPNSPKGIEPTYATREVSHLVEKMAIAEKVFELVEDRDTIVIDLGTTTLEAAKKLVLKEGLTVLTNSMPIATELIANETFKIFLLGGQLRNGEFATSGALSVDFLSHFRVDKAIIGPGGVTAKNGITDYHFEEAQVRKKMIEIADTVIAVADYSKIGVSAFTQVCELNEVDIIVTDWNVSQKAIQELRSEKTQVLVVPKP